MTTFYVYRKAAKTCCGIDDLIEIAKGNSPEDVESEIFQAIKDDMSDKLKSGCISMSNMLYIGHNIITNKDIFHIYASSSNAHGTVISQDYQIEAEEYIDENL